MHRSILVLLLCVTFACQAAKRDARPVVQVDPPPTVHTVDCGFPTGTLDVTCGFIEVWENRTARAGRKIPFHFVLARSIGENPRPDPMVFLAGGPGQHGTDAVPGMLFRFGGQLKQRDVLFVDQRGTGRSNPLDCVSWDFKADPDGFRRMFEQDFFDPGTFRECLDALRPRANLEWYTTSAIADDLEELRAALGYETLNLFGGSYGTRLALEFVRRHPASARSAVLAGVAPSFAILVETVARDLEDGLEALIRDCQADTVCGGDYPRFREQLREVLDRVRREPVSLTVTNPGTGRPETVTLNYRQLVTALRYRLYSVLQSAGLPRQVRTAAEEGRFEPLAGALPALLPPLHNTLFEGMWASVICTEEMTVVDLERARELSRGTVLGTQRLDSTLGICSVWPKGRVPAGFHDPVVSDVPVLLIAAEHDVASPLRLAEEASRHLSRGTLVALSNRSHYELGGEPCVDGIIDAFLRAGSGEGIDLACASQSKRPPFARPR